MSFIWARKIIVFISLLNLGLLPPVNLYAQGSEFPTSSGFAALMVSGLPQLANKFIAASQSTAAAILQAKYSKIPTFGSVQNPKFKGCSFPTMPKPLPTKCKELEPTPNNYMSLARDEAIGMAQ